MDITLLLTQVGILAAIVSAAVEWIKHVLDTVSWDDRLSDDQRAMLVQLFAFLVGAFVALMAQFDVVHVLLPSSTLPVVACYVLSGIALALPADALKTVLQWAKAARDGKQAQADATTPTSMADKTPPA